MRCMSPGPGRKREYPEAYRPRSRAGSRRSRNAETGQSPAPRRTRSLRVERPVVRDELHLPSGRDLIFPILVDVRDQGRRLLGEVLRVELQDLRQPHRLLVRLQVDVALLVVELSGLPVELGVDLVRLEGLARQPRDASATGMTGEA